MKVALGSNLVSLILPIFHESLLLTPRLFPLKTTKYQKVESNLSLMLKISRFVDQLTNRDNALILAT